MKIATADFTVGNRAYKKGDEIGGRALADVERVRPDLVADPTEPEPKPKPNNKKDEVA